MRCCVQGLIPNIPVDVEETRETSKRVEAEIRGMRTMSIPTQVFRERAAERYRKDYHHGTERESWCQRRWLGAKYPRDDQTRQPKFRDILGLSRPPLKRDL